MSEVQYLRKISTAKVYGSPPDGPEKGQTDLYMVWGQATAVKRGNSDYGPYVALIGTFEAVNLKTNEMYRAPQCFLPRPFDESIAQSVEAGNVVDFAFKVSVKKAPVGSGQRYEYVTTPIQDPNAKDPLEALRGRIPNLPQLEAPATGKK